MTEIEPTPPETHASQPDVPRRRRWLALLVFLMPLVGLLWVSNWFYQRSRLFTDSYVVLGEPYLPWGKLIGDDTARELFGVPVGLNPHTESLSTYQVGLIGGYTPLESLQLHGMTDSDVSRLSGLVNLESLSLYDAAITDEACEVLSDLPRLRSLNITAATSDRQPLEITDTGVSFLAELLNLEDLRLQSPHLTDDSLLPIGRLTLLILVSLTDAKIEGRELQHLANLPNLTGLELINCPLQQGALANLVDSQKLQGINLKGSTVTDEMLMSLVPIKSLHVVLLEDTQVTREGVLRLLEARPDLVVSDSAGLEVEATAATPP